MTQKELLELIEKVAKTRKTSLDLSSKKLKCLPPEIGKLQNLRTLYLHSNQLSSLPPEIGKLKNIYFKRS